MSHSGSEPSSPKFGSGPDHPRLGHHNRSLPSMLPLRTQTQALPILRRRNTENALSRLERTSQLPSMPKRRISTESNASSSLQSSQEIDAGSESDSGTLQRKKTDPHLRRRTTKPHLDAIPVTGSQPENEMPPTPKTKSQLQDCVAAVTQAPFMPEKRSVFDLTKQRKNLSPYVPGTFVPLLPPSTCEHKNTLILDIDETLVHASVDPKPCDIKIPVTFRNTQGVVYVKLRPGVTEFLAWAYERFEVVTFTASLPLYASPLMDILDPKKKLHGRLYREHCNNYSGVLVKDLFRLGRPLERTIIIDNSPQAFSLQPRNGIPIRSFMGEKHDSELESIIPLLKRLADTDDVYPILDGYNSTL